MPPHFKAVDTLGAVDALSARRQAVHTSTSTSAKTCTCPCSTTCSQPDLLHSHSKFSSPSMQRPVQRSSPTCCATNTPLANNAAPSPPNRLPTMQHPVQRLSPTCCVISPLANNAASSPASSPTCCAATPFQSNGPAQLAAPLPPIQLANSAAPGPTVQQILSLSFRMLVISNEGKPRSPAGCETSFAATPLSASEPHQEVQLS